MNEYEEKLKRHIEENSVDCQHLVFKKSCHSVEEAADAAGATPGDFVKNICMSDSEGNIIVAIVKGEDRVGSKRLAKALGIERPKTAKPENILEKTGYPVGGIPSFGYEAVFIVDERVMEKDIVYTGGGSPNSLVKINTAELLSANGGIVARVRK
ncbi:MAG TPA: YbaK/EbsC family protein [Clostridia bacterium]|nr:YbaK/EbsC family protein [Clostridia bacterium]